MELKTHKLVGTEAEFSVHWLHKSERYYSMTKATGRDISVEALSTLAARLNSVSQCTIEEGLHLDQDAARCVADLAERVAAELRERALTRTLRRRPAA